MKSLVAFATVSAVAIAASWSILSGLGQTEVTYQDRHATPSESLPVREIHDRTFVFTPHEPGADSHRSAAK
jgi:hypothetical protein